MHWYNVQIKAIPEYMLKHLLQFVVFSFGLRYSSMGIGMY